MDINKVELTIKEIRQLEDLVRKANEVTQKVEVKPYDSREMFYILTLPLVGTFHVHSGNDAQRIADGIYAAFEEYLRSVRGAFNARLEEKRTELAALCNPTVTNVVINGAKNVTITPEESL